MHAVGQGNILTLWNVYGLYEKAFFNRNFESEYKNYYD